MGRIPKLYWSLPVSEYKGLPSRCSPGTHEAAEALLRKHPEIRGAVLDLASGTGALLARLRDIGFAELHAVELETTAFKLPDVVPIPVDLNTEFSSSFPRKFDLITAIEIMEHLDSPRHFLRHVRDLLTDNGYLLLSTLQISPIGSGGCGSSHGGRCATSKSVITTIRDTFHQ